MENIIITIISSIVGPAIIIFLKWLFSDRAKEIEAKANAKAADLRLQEEEKERKMQAAKQNILQLIMEDELAIMNNQLPDNYQAILHEFEIYTNNGGNSYVAEKVNKYKAKHNTISINK